MWSTGPGCGWGPGPGGRGHDGLEDAVGQRRDWNPTKTKPRSLVSPQDSRRSNRQGVTSFTHPRPPCVCVLWPGGARRWEALVKGAALPSRRLPCGRGMREGTANSILTANAVPGESRAPGPWGAGSQPSLGCEFSLQSPRLWGGRELRRMGALGPESADGPGRQGGPGSSLRTVEARTGPRWRANASSRAQHAGFFFFFF